MKVADVPIASSEDFEGGAGFVKADTGKPKLSRIPGVALEEIARVLNYGAVKYDWDNWRKCKEPRRYYDAALRHIYAASGGEKNDPDSQLPHMAHAACCLLFVLALEKE